MQVKTKIWVGLKRFSKKLRGLAGSAKFAKLYLLASLVVLFGTTLLWSLLSLNVQQNNADQLINPVLLNGGAAFGDADFPAQHTFLLKWPLFLIISLAGLSSGAYFAVSALVVMVTVAALAYILFRIERRPIVLGTLLLSLASCLLLVPAQPYAGALLPVNLAMLTTRNVEYVVFVIALYILFKQTAIRSWSFLFAVVLLILLAASDKLFLTLTLGGSAIALVVYALSKGWNLVSLSVRWFIASLLAGVGTIGLLWAIDALHIANIATQIGAGPYQLVQDFHSLVLGMLYGFLGILTNFGANPGYDANVVRQIPSQALARLLGFEGPAMIINLLLLAGGVGAIYWVIKRSLQHNRDGNVLMDATTKLSVSLIWVSAAALLAFVLSNHYYAVDARYLTIFVFAVAIAAAVFAKNQNWANEKLIVCGALISIGMTFSLAGVYHTYSSEKNALADISNRNRLVSQVLQQHEVTTLVGDYWRVVPIKQKMPNNKLSGILPLDNCSQRRTALTSSAWNVDLSKTSFAYLLSLDGGLTNFPNCKLDDVIKQYGRPNNSVIVAGSQTNPKELILFYDKGAWNSSPTITLKTPSTILPIPLSQLPYTSCPNGTTIMNIVAHEDDDLLFMNPDTLTALQQGHCIRTVYVTAGDAGSGDFYWLSRERGSEAAYSQTLGSDALWIRRVVQLGPKQFIQVTHPRSDYRVSLIFMHLPDGNTAGSGFRRYLYESLAGLESGRNSNLQTVDTQSSYDSAQLIDGLTSLMKAYQPVEIRTQSNLTTKQYREHSDHMAVGRYAKKAAAKYALDQFENTLQIPVKYYVGYPVHAMPENVSGTPLSLKFAAWYRYAKFDGGVCQNDTECNGASVYGVYLKRQYQNAY